MIQMVVTFLLCVACFGSGCYIGYSDGFRYGYSKCLEHNSKKVKKVFKK
ncbi:hypothetical protein pW4_82 [Bacillus phage pW4]|uniref:Uncharacterized protein n=1 Tax=Bacillus phage pW4 TaxID=2500560 RepID=A0A3Q9R7S7_9CAUD|nr:hypothetical protein PP656_gp057 [Bacillus phage pW4]AZU99097.1 hypothetical protein pW4_82 [Bacillus phage pW4]